jgi:hypothetical protein
MHETEMLDEKKEEVKEIFNLQKICQMDKQMNGFN